MFLQCYHALRVPETLILSDELRLSSINAAPAGSSASSSWCSCALSSAGSACSFCLLLLTVPTLRLSRCPTLQTSWENPNLQNREGTLWHPFLCDLGQQQGEEDTVKASLAVGAAGNTLSWLSNSQARVAPVPCNTPEDAIALTVLGLSCAKAQPTAVLPAAPNQMPRWVQ